MAVIELLVDALKKDGLMDGLCVPDSLMLNCLGSVDRALNFDLFASDEADIQMQTCSSSKPSQITPFDIKAYLLKYNGADVLNDLLGYKNEEIAQFAIKIQQDYIEQTDEEEIKNAMEIAQTHNGHLYDDRKEYEMFRI